MWNDKIFMTREQIRKLDAIAMDEVGIPGPVLMENAGRGAALAAMRLAPSKRAAVLAGPGNNGGDGFVIARHLVNHGFQVTVYLAVPRKKVKGDALLNLEILDNMGFDIVDVSTPAALADLADRFRSDGFLVDALLGTGVSREVEGHLAELIRAVNRAEIPVLAVDIPSGLDADTGRPLGAAVRATATATFGHLKRGLVIFPGAELAGAVEVIPIGVPGFVSDRAGIDGRIIGEEDVRSLVPRRGADSHKGTFGHLLVLAGTVGKTGAAAMVGRAALRSGTGLVTVATTAYAQPILEAKCLEVMVEHVIERADAPMGQKVARRLAQLLSGKQAAALGPGLTTAPGMAGLVLCAIETLEVPAVIDADGINILAADPAVAGRAKAPLVLTPHPGEMARLLNRTTADVQADRIGAAREAARAHRAVVVLKGARTVVASPDGGVFVNPTGNAGMASAGMGDVLTGVIGGFLAQGVLPLEAALLGVYVHGLAGDRSAERIGAAGLVASDVIDELPRVLAGWAI